MRTSYFVPVVTIFIYSFFFSFPRLFSAVGYWMPTILPHIRWPYNGLNACLKWAARSSLKIQDAKITQNCHLHTIAQGCRAISLQWRHVSTIGKKLVKQQYILHMFSQYGERRPTNSWDRFESLGHPSTFQRVSRLGFVTAPTSLNEGQSNFARCLAVSWDGTLYNVSQNTAPFYFCNNFVKQSF